VILFEPFFALLCGAAELAVLFDSVSSVSITSMYCLAESKSCVRGIGWVPPGVMYTLPPSPTHLISIANRTSRGGGKGSKEELPIEDLTSAVENDPSLGLLGSCCSSFFVVVVVGHFLM
jgi:hypothetical protein